MRLLPLRARRTRRPPLACSSPVTWAPRTAGLQGLLGQFTAWRTDARGCDRRTWHYISFESSLATIDSHCFLGALRQALCTGDKGSVRGQEGGGLVPRDPVMLFSMFSAMNGRCYIREE